MNERSKTALDILPAAAVIGVLGNALLRQTPWGLNAFLFVAVFVAGLFFITKRRRPELLTVGRAALMAAMVFFGAMFVFRDSIELRVYDTFAILVIMGVLVLAPLGISIRFAGVFHYVCGFVWSGLTSAFGSFALLGADVDWKSMPGTRLSRQIFSVLRGVAVAVPLVLIFGVLFSSADARFEILANRLINFDLNNVLSHGLITLGLAWLSAGYLRGSLVTPALMVPAVPVDAAAAETGAGEPTLSGLSVLEHINRSDAPDFGSVPDKSVRKIRDWQNVDSSILPPVFTLGIIETVIILGLVDLVFLAFVVVQAPYLFGGMELVQSTPDFKLADYARRGFGELVLASALVLPMLLVSHWLLRSGTKRLAGVFRALAGLQVAMVFVIMASAVQRLVLLTGEAGYGMTAMRFYPLVFMIWLAVVFGWFALTIFRGRRQIFAWGALWSAIVILGLTNLINPDAFIVRTNVELMNRGRSFDANYNAGFLSADAVPTVLLALSSMPADAQCQAKFSLHNEYRGLGESGGVRSFNLARRKAFKSLRANDAALHELTGCPSWMSVGD